MTTREEIREGIAMTGYERMFDAKWEDLSSNSVERHLWLMVSDSQMQYLHSKGVVIKIEADIPFVKYSHIPTLDEGYNRGHKLGFKCGAIDMLDAYVKAGYSAVEELIEEEE